MKSAASPNGNVSRQLFVHGSLVIEAREGIVSDVTIKAAVRTPTDASAQVAFYCATATRTKSLDASAVGTIAFRAHLDSPSRRTRFERSDCASLRALLRSLLLPSLSRTLRRGLHTTSSVTCSLIKSYNQDVALPSIPAHSLVTWNLRAVSIPRPLLDKPAHLWEDGGQHRSLFYESRHFRDRIRSALQVSFPTRAGGCRTPGVPSRAVARLWI